MKEQTNEFESGRPGGNGNQRQARLPEQTEEVAERARAAAIEKVEYARDRAREGIDQSKQQMADRIRRVGSALRSASDKLREEDQMAARYADIASEGVERAARYVGSTDLSRAVRDLEGFARRQPALFFGGAFLVGLAAGRFLQSTQHRRENRRDLGLQAAHEHPDTATDWPRPQRAASMPAPETEGLFDTESGRPGLSPPTSVPVTAPKPPRGST